MAKSGAGGEEHVKPEFKGYGSFEVGLEKYAE